MSQFEILSAVHGIAPRSDELHLLGTAVEKGRAPVEEFEALKAQETADWLAFQQEAGIDIYEDGKLNWQDRLRPIVKATRGFSEGIDDAPVTRWFETNTFYREPTITDKLVFDIDKFVDEVGELGDTLSLLSPNEFAEHCQVAYERPNNVQCLYRQIVREVGAAGVKRLIFGRYSGNAAPSSFTTEVTLADQENSPAIVQLPLKPVNFFANSVGRLLRPAGHEERWLPIAVGDNTAEDRLPTDQELTFIAGNDLSRLVLTNSVDFEFLPLIYAQAKVKRLAGITNYTKERIAQL